MATNTLHLLLRRDWQFDWQFDWRRWLTARVVGNWMPRRGTTRLT